MSYVFSNKELHEWCSISALDLKNHPKRRINFEIVENSIAMGNAMADELIELIIRNNQTNRKTRAIIPCGPKCWYEPFAGKVNASNVSLRNLMVFHMDECLDWQGKLLPKNHPYNFRAFMERYFYNPVDASLSVPLENRFFLTPGSLNEIKTRIADAPIDITLGGWGQDGHVAYNQARRNPYSPLTLDDLRTAEARIQDNNPDTIITLAHRSFGAAYRFTPPMSITLGIKECFSAKKIRVYSDTGAWKQTALRVALFSPPTAEYPMTLLQEHADARIVATLETARHPISENPDWDFFGASGYFKE